MRNALLIAFREYLENARTRGFWISILALPVVLLISLAAPAFLEDKAIPSRYFIIHDAGGWIEPDLIQSIAQQNRGELVQAMRGYLGENALPGKLDEALEGLEAWQNNAATAGDAFDMAPFLPMNPPAFDPPKPRFIPLPLPGDIQGSQTPDEIIEFLKPYLRGQNMNVESEGQGGVSLFAVVIVPPAQPGQTNPAARQIQYWSTNPGDDSLLQRISHVADRKARREALRSRGLDIQTIEQTMNIHVPVAEYDARKDEGLEAVNMSDKIRQWAPSGFVYLLFISLFAVMQLLLNSTIEEKSNRLLEILLSSVRPVEIMIGKLLGNGLAGLTLVGVWVLLMAGFAAFRMDTNSELSQGIAAAVTSTGLVPAFLLYFVLGFLIYSGLFLMVGSVSQTVKDAQSYTGFFMIIMIVPLMTMFVIPRDPNGVLAITLSWIPIYTPFVMLNRLSGNPPLWEILGTLVLCSVTIVIILSLAARVFKRSIISIGSTGKRGPKP